MLPFKYLHAFTPYFFKRRPPNDELYVLLLFTKIAPNDETVTFLILGHVKSKRRNTRFLLLLFELETKTRVRFQQG